MRQLKTILAAAAVAGLLFCAGCENNSSETYNIAGRWTVTITYAGNEVEVWIFNLSQTDQTVTGTSYESSYPGDTVSITGTLDGSEIILSENWGVDGTYIYFGAVQSANSMNGTSRFSNGDDAGTWTAVKQ